MLTVFRGVASDHPAYRHAVLGLVLPRLQVATNTLSNRRLEMYFDQHVGGNTNTPFTSWTAHFGVASFYACKSETPGLVLQATIRATDVFVPKNYVDYFNQMEYLVLGKVNAMISREPDCPGMYSIFG